jgi:hypothetical protein
MEQEKYGKSDWEEIIWKEQQKVQREERGRIGNQDRVMGKGRLGWSKEEGTIEEACSRDRATRNTARLAPAKITYI